MIAKLRDILGMLSGYKQQYEATKAELDEILTEAEPLIDKILIILKGWNEPNSKTE